MDVVLSVLQIVLFTFLLLLWGRLILSWVTMFARDWTPKGAVLVGAEGIMTLTDPPIHAMRRVVPSPQIGPIRIDLSFLLVMIITYIAYAVVIGAR